MIKEMNDSLMVFDYDVLYDNIVLRRWAEYGTDDYDLLFSIEDYLSTYHITCVHRSCIIDVFAKTIEPAYIRFSSPEDLLLAELNFY